MDKARYSNEAPEEVTRESLIAIADSEAPEAVTRESLIAISYSEPDKNLTSKNLSSGKLNGETVGKALDSDEEKFRTELISISYAQSPEAEGLPVPMGELAN